MSDKNKVVQLDQYKSKKDLTKGVNNEADFFKKADTDDTEGMVKYSVDVSDENLLNKF